MPKAASPRIAHALPVIGVLLGPSLLTGAPAPASPASPGADRLTSASSLSAVPESPSRRDVLSAVRELGGSLARASDRRSAAPVLQADEKPFHEFYFTRAIYPMYRGLNTRRWGGGFGNRGRCGNHRWCTDWPEADIHLSGIIEESIAMDVYIGENSVDLDDPILRRFPFLYLVEPGYMTLTDRQREGLRSYLLQGGFLVLDDFWGTNEYANFAWEMSLLLPEYPIVDIPLNHPLFHTVYDIEEIVQVPMVRNAQGGPTWEQDGYEPWVRGIFAADGRLIVLANVHTDIGDGMEHADNPYYPMEYSKYAFFMEMNMIVYALAN